MKIAICDDNALDAQHLVSMIGGTHQHRIFPSAEQLLFEIEEQNAHFDLYLLDIFMGEMDGIGLGGQIRELDGNALICFITSSRDFYAEAFSLYAFQYLLKPVMPDEFQKLLQKASEQFAHDCEQSVRLNYRGRYISIPYSRILYICSMGHALYIHCKDDIIERHSGRLDEFARLLDSSVFARCHQSYIINLYNVSSLESDFFLCGTEQVPISRRYAAIKERYRLLLFQDMD